MVAREMEDSTACGIEGGGRGLGPGDQASPEKGTSESEDI